MQTGKRFKKQDIIYLKDDELTTALIGLMENFPERNLIPFARLLGTDIIACHSNDLPGKVLLINSQATPGWEDEGVFDV